MTDCLIGKPRRRPGRRVRICVALAAGAGDEAALVIAMARRLIAVLVLLGVLATFARVLQQRWFFWDQDVLNIDDALLRTRSYATCRCCVNLPLQVRGM